MSSKPKTLIKLIVIFTITAFLIGYRACSISIEEYYSEFGVSSSVEDSKKNKVFIERAKIKPDRFMFKNFDIEIEEVWIESKSRVEYDYFLFRKQILLDGEALCVSIKQTSVIPEATEMVLSFEGESMVERHIEGNRVYHSDFLPKIKKETIISIVPEAGREEVENITLHVKRK